MCFRKDATVVSLKSRYANMYIPSDFFSAEFPWHDAFPLLRPFQLGKSCSFYVMHKDVERPGQNTAALDPADADHLYSAKVSKTLPELRCRICAWLYCLNIGLVVCNFTFCLNTNVARILFCVTGLVAISGLENCQNIYSSKFKRDGKSKQTTLYIYFF